TINTRGHDDVADRNIFDAARNPHEESEFWLKELDCPFSLDGGERVPGPRFHYKSIKRQKFTSRICCALGMSLACYIRKPPDDLRAFDRDGGYDKNPVSVRSRAHISLVAKYVLNTSSKTLSSMFAP